MKKLITLLIILSVSNAFSQIQVTKHAGKVIVKFPSDGDDTSIKFYKDNAGGFGAVIPGKDILNTNLTGDCVTTEQSVNIGTTAAVDEIKYKFDCTQDSQTVTFYITATDAEKPVLYLRNDKFIREGIKVTIERGELSIHGDDFKSIAFYKDRSSNDLIAGNNTIDISTFGAGCNATEKFVTIKAAVAEVAATGGAHAVVAIPAQNVKYKLDCTNKSISFSKDNGSAEILQYDETSKTFKKNVLQTTKSADTQLADFPLPKFNQPLRKDFDKRNRLLFIDSDPRKMALGDNSGLKKYRKVKEEENSNEKGEATETGKIYKHIPADALPNKGMLAVVIADYNFVNLENFTIDVNGTQFNYSKDISDLSEKLKALTTDPNKTNESGGAVNYKNNNTAESPLAKKLDQIIDILRSYDSMNINDLQVVLEYKKTLWYYYDSHTADFKDAELERKDIIMSWHPKNISLAPIPIDTKDADEIEISYNLKYAGSNSVSKPLGTFHTIGKFSVDYGTGFFVSNLKNNEIYTETVTVDNIEKKYAKIGDDNTSLGLGVNFDLSYRTGSELRPTFNFGMFVPLDEDLTPFVSTGFGIGIYGKNYKVNFSYGLAVGKINSIKDQYKNVDLSSLDLTNTELGEKKLKIGNYFGLAISFNILGKQP